MIFSPRVAVGSQTVLADQLRSFCIAGVFLLAGTPESVSLLFSVAAGRIDTHVLMTMACFGTLAIGSALEVGGEILSWSSVAVSAVQGRVPVDGRVRIVKTDDGP